MLNFGKTYTIFTRFYLLTGYIVDRNVVTLDIKGWHTASPIYTKSPPVLISLSVTTINIELELLIVQSKSNLVDYHYFYKSNGHKKSVHDRIIIKCLLPGFKSFHLTVIIEMMYVIVMTRW